METEDRQIIEYVLQTLNKLKVGQEEIAARLRANQRGRGVPAHVVTSAGDQRVRFANEIHGTRPELKKRMEEGEPQLKCGYVERPLNEDPNRNMRLNVAGSEVKPRITQHSSETPCMMCEHSVVREKPRYPPAECGRFPASPTMDVRCPRSIAPGMIDRGCGYGPCAKGDSQRAAQVCGQDVRRYSKPSLPVEDIFWRERQKGRSQKREIRAQLERERREGELKAQQPHKGPGQGKIQTDGPKEEIESRLAGEAPSENCSNPAERTESPTAQVDCTPLKKTRSRELRGGVLFSKNPRTKTNGLNAPVINS